MKRFVHAIIGFLLFAPVVASAQTFEGTVTHVADGDTISLGDVRIRLQGISAPETNERHGAAATGFMRELVLGEFVVCQSDGSRSYDRVVAVCVLNGRDIGAAIIEAGYALDCPRFSGGRYQDAERIGQARYRLDSYRLPGYCRG